MTEFLSKTLLFKGYFDFYQVLMRALNGDEIRHHVVVMSPAVAILPYDPDRGVALVVSMPRGPVAMAGLPDMLEAVAGRRETADAEACARREAFEEAGVELHLLHHVGAIWPAAANVQAEVDYYLAEYSLADRTGAGGGLPEEFENITVHEIALRELWSSYEDRSLQDAKLVLLLLALRAERGDLFVRDAA